MHYLILPRHTFLTATGMIFLFVGLLQATRAFYQWDAVIDGWMVPIWLSWVFAFVALTLSYNAFVSMK